MSCDLAHFLTVLGINETREAEGPLDGSRCDAGMFLWQMPARWVFAYVFSAHFTDTWQTLHHISVPRTSISSLNCQKKRENYKARADYTWAARFWTVIFPPLFQDLFWGVSLGGDDSFSEEDILSRKGKIDSQCFKKAQWGRERGRGMGCHLGRIHSHKQKIPSDVQGSHSWIFVIAKKTEKSHSWLFVIIRDYSWFPEIAKFVMVRDYSWLFVARICEKPW